MYNLLIIQAPYFQAGAVLKDGMCIRAAPIIKWMVGRTETEIRKKCHHPIYKVKL